MAEQREAQGTGEEPRTPNTPSLDHRGTGEEPRTPNTPSLDHRGTGEEPRTPNTSSLDHRGTGEEPRTPNTSSLDHRGTGEKPRTPNTSSLDHRVTGEKPRTPNTSSLDHRVTGGTFQECQDVVKGEVITRSTREKNGRFTNPWPTWHYPSSASLLRFYLLDKDHSNVPRSKEVRIPSLTYWLFALLLLVNSRFHWQFA
ncbi:neurofilament medium polypeptide-like [Salvelinus alpinus]|uniref:neurofilament medium polypeptide-like n=1 Tax=Salvelinus alpinus TaxID=8036 RepID=UPI0039FC561B